MEYTIVRHHRRKKLVVVVNAMGEVTVKAPLRTSVEKIEKFIEKETEWINSQKQYFAQKFHHRVMVTREERDRLKKQLLPEMKILVEKYAAIMELDIKSVKITIAERRWGSCGKNGAICFSYRLALVSARCREYLVVHELSHLKQFNHSKDFYAVVESYFPDYKAAEKELDGYYIHLRQ